MCGIVGYVGKKRVVPVIIDGLRRLEYRGYDSAGIAVCGNGDALQIRRAEGKLRNLEEVIRLKPLESVIPAGPRTAVLRKRTRIPIGIALGVLSWCTTASSKTTSR
jgi:hypothetical protein